MTVAFIFLCTLLCHQRSVETSTAAAAGLKVKAISPPCPQSLSEEMLPTAAVMEEQLQEATQSSLWWGATLSRVETHSHTHTHTGTSHHLSSPIRFQTPPWRLPSEHTIKTRSTARTLQAQHFNKVKQSVNLDEWVFWHYKCCQETPSTSTSQPVELSIRVPLLERSRLCAISWPISPNGFSRVLINRDFNSSGQGLWLSVQPRASRGASLRRPCPGKDRQLSPVASQWGAEVQL